MLSQALLLINSNQIPKFFIFTLTSVLERLPKKEIYTRYICEFTVEVSFPNYSLVYSSDPGPCNSTKMWPVLSECCTDGVLSLHN